MNIFINAYESISAAGFNDGLREAMFSSTRRGVSVHDDLADRPIYFGRINDELVLSDEQLFERYAPLKSIPLTRTDRLIGTVLARLQPTIDNLKNRYGLNRLGIVLGSSVAGMLETENYFLGGQTDDAYDDTILEIAGPVRTVQLASGITGPAYAISTACSSSAKALASAARLIRAGVIDAAIAGGIDGMSRFTIAGFTALGAVSDALTLPFSANREGINLGEGGALFILSRECDAIELAGWGETSDAHHISSPDPKASEVIRAIDQAMQQAQLDRVDYINAHGTGTVLNDAMESTAIYSRFGNQVPVSSTKPITGHTLGGAGALEAAVACLTLEDKDGRLPLHFYDGLPDSELPAIDLVTSPRSGQNVRSVLSHSFAFGGNNAVLILKKH